MRQWALRSYNPPLTYTLYFSLFIKDSQDYSTSENTQRSMHWETMVTHTHTQNVGNKPQFKSTN